MVLVQKRHIITYPSCSCIFGICLPWPGPVLANQWPGRHTRVSPGWPRGVLVPPSMPFTDSSQSRSGGSSVASSGSSWTLRAGQYPLPCSGTTCRRQRFAGSGGSATRRSGPVRKLRFRDLKGKGMSDPLRVCSKRINKRCIPQ